ncbi:helix-turn-helix domain-containing protein [Gracilibacillus alcaliphilus]|uniref:helix-turn-helix domain-containing protein n=1 Tax=Gracilibacillus alcaliphilus TaxID=1401441 RepID=UPI00195EF1B6|nr:helix-turn-helix domain-containing protein [Gracilibacillus alcaliphilus]MBM7679771.1 transcriptional regulator with XRE-family HTH domain [Gracilibacillus alcaliphilus]
MDAIQKIISHNLVQIRKGRGLSLDKVAELTGVSKAMLAQIEKGKTNPTVSTLWKIANGLQVSFSMFMKEPEQQKIEKVTLDQLTPVQDDTDHYLVYSLFPYHPERKFEVYAIKLESGYSHVSDKHLGEEYVLIQSGELTIEIQGETFVLTSNQSLKFKANTEHRYMNHTDQLVSYYMVIYYPDQE